QTKSLRSECSTSSIAPLQWVPSRFDYAKPAGWTLQQSCWCIFFERGPYPSRFLAACLPLIVLNLPGFGRIYLVPCESFNTPLSFQACLLITLEADSMQRNVKFTLGPQDTVSFVIPCFQ